MWFIIKSPYFVIEQSSLGPPLFFLFFTTWSEDQGQGSVTHFVVIFDVQVQKNTADLLHCVFR